MRWRHLVPPWHGWPRLLISFSSYLLVASALATAVGKALAVAQLEGIHHPVILLAWALAADGVVYFGVIALLALLEGLRREARLITYPLAIGGAITATLNTGYLIISGEQATWEAFSQLFSRIQDVADITREGIDTTVILLIFGGVIVGSALPLGLRALLRRRLDLDRSVHGRARMICAAWLAAAAALIMVSTPRPSQVMARNLGKNAFFSTLRTLVVTLESGSFTGYEPVRLVAPETLAEWADDGRRPNIVVVVLESTRYDRTSLAGEGEDFAATPHLAGLAAAGAVAHRARAVLPHTTKSLFSILCGRLPTMQRRVVEVFADLEVQCLPAILSEAGYATKFLQSSWGTFEWRPRLVQRLGFTEFLAWEDIGGEVLGYLASDDESLTRPFADWIDGLDPDLPFFATLLTSATHHPYRLSHRAKRKADRAKLPHQSDQERYLRLLEAGDRMLGGVVGALEARGLLDETYIIVVGDHGEGFGDKGVKQHDNNFYEEGLRVPLVIVGPGIEHREIPGNASLIDITPTLLRLLGIPLVTDAENALVGEDLLAEGFDGTGPRWFSCWFEMRCRGFVIGERKVVYEPQSDELWYYDLVEDPEESHPLVLTPDLEVHFKALQELLERHRARRWRVQWGQVALGEWFCAEDDPYCKHPRASKETHRLEVADHEQSEASPAKAR